MPAASAARSPSKRGQHLLGAADGVSGQFGRVHAADVGPADHLHRRPPDDPPGPLADRQPGDHPVPAAGAVDRHVHHDRRTGGGGQLHLDADQLAEHPQLQCAAARTGAG